MAVNAHTQKKWTSLTPPDTTLYPKRPFLYDTYDCHSLCGPKPPLKPLRTIHLVPIKLAKKCRNTSEKKLDFFISSHFAEWAVKALAGWINGLFHSTTTKRRKRRRRKNMQKDLWLCELLHERMHIVLSAFFGVPLIKQLRRRSKESRHFYAFMTGGLDRSYQPPSIPHAHPMHIPCPFHMIIFCYYTII